MIKLMKYEIRETHKFMTGILVLVLLLITGLHAAVGQDGSASAFGSMFVLFSMLTFFGAGLAAFLYIVGSFKKELYEDRGYLTFTLPVTGYQILGAKLLVAVMWFILISFVTFFYLIFAAMAFGDPEINTWELIKELFQLLPVKALAVDGIFSFISMINILILIYFSMAVGRMTFRNKKIGGIWFIIFLVLAGLFSFGRTEISELLPYYLDLETFRILNLEGIAASNLQVHLDSGFALNVQSEEVVNIASVFYTLITFVILFFGTGYLIEKKIDL